MSIITGDEAAAKGLDPDREWVEATCPDGHVNHAENHDADGARAECGTCGEKFDYGQRAEQVAADAVAAEAESIVRHPAEDA